MRFNKHVPRWRREFLEKQFKEYIKDTSMTKKEEQALREWVAEGNSVYENPDGAWADGHVPIEFLTVYRDNEYIRKNTKGMNPEEVRKFAMNYYGWDDDIPEVDDMQDKGCDLENGLSLPLVEELPFL